MSVYAKFEDDDPTFFSSNSGWSDVIKWSDTLNEEEHADLLDLISNGITESIPEASVQLGSAINKFPVNMTTLATLRELRELLDGKTGIVIITNGFSV